MKSHEQELSERLECIANQIDVALALYRKASIGEEELLVYKQQFRAKANDLKNICDEMRGRIQRTVLLDD